MATKAQTLRDIEKNLKSVNVLPCFVLSTQDYYNNKEGNLYKIRSYFNEQLLIIRSSAAVEDGVEQSCAGHFTSVLNVDKNCDDLSKAIDSVILSYKSDEDNEVLIQPMMSVKIAGVVFTSDIDTLASYYIVNYEEGGCSDGVTSGVTNDIKTRIVFKNNPKINEKWLMQLFESCKKLEQYYNNDYLDIEFGVTDDGKVCIFQVRPLANLSRIEKYPLELSSVLNKIYKKIEKLKRPHPNLLGSNTAFGVMPDWNPAEIIGVRPKMLALSLYKQLITDETWAHQRNNYGYRNLVGHPLMVTFAGMPYVDVRITFNSFIPKKLHSKIATKLANYYISRFISMPNYHDKVEFEIVYSCYYLGISDKLRELQNYDFNTDELKRIEFELLSITNDIIQNDGLYVHDLEKIKILDNKYESIMNSDLSLIDKIYWLIEDCKQYGTLPFAGIARAGFVAVQFLHSFVDLKIITKEECLSFMASLDTVSRTMNSDLKRVFDNELTKEEFLIEYGHIRPGTYDIMSKRYDEDFDLYFASVPTVTRSSHVNFSSNQIKVINELLIDCGLHTSADELIRFIKNAIEGREYAKFKFTRHLSGILLLMEELGMRYDICREDVAFLNIDLVKNLYSSVECVDLKPLFKKNIAHNKNMYEYTKLIKLPSVVLNPNDVYDFSLLNEEPNFVTQGCVVGEVLKEEDFDKQHLIGKIVFIKSADPGYDYIFGKNIKGLVSQYGGANSHMAIRCAELGVPAVIGIGEKEFDKWSNKNRIYIDCLAKKITGFEGE